MDKAKHGAIIFSLGTNLQCDRFDVQVKKAFLKVFSEIPQTVIWKYDSDDIKKDLPKNVFLKKWLPQNDVLGWISSDLFVHRSNS